METTIRWYRVDRREISFMKFILEAYDNMAVVSTVDRKRGVVQIRIAPGCEMLVDDIVTGLPATIAIATRDETDASGHDVAEPI